MSFDKKSEAEIHAAAIQGILGDEWTARVWDNLGWHCAWERDYINLHYSTYGNSYTCLIGTHGGGHIDLSVEGDGSSRDPKEAIRIACEEAQKVFREKWQPIQDSVANIMSAL